MGTRNFLNRHAARDCFCGQFLEALDGPLLGRRCRDGAPTVWKGLIWSTRNLRLRFWA